MKKRLALHSQPKKQYHNNKFFLRKMSEAFGPEGS